MGWNNLNFIFNKKGGYILYNLETLRTNHYQEINTESWNTSSKELR